MTYAKQIFAVLCVLWAPRESPDATDVLLKTGQERDLLLGLTWLRIEVIECFKSLSPSTDLCQTGFSSPLRAQGSRERPDPTVVLLETGQERNFLWGLIWARNQDN